MKLNAICANCEHYKMVLGHMFCCKDPGDKDGSKYETSTCKEFLRRRGIK